MRPTAEPLAYRVFRDELARLQLPRLAGGGIIGLASIDSTNSLARRLLGSLEGLEALPLPALIAALEQTAGRGRMGRQWSSPAGRGVYATVVMTLPQSSLPTLPMAVGLGLAAALDPFLGRRCRLKWPNDLVVDGRKIGGLLLETSPHREGSASVLVGFGVNWLQRERDLPIPSATSILLEGRIQPGYGELLQALVEGLLEALEEDRRAVARTVEHYTDRAVHRPGDALRWSLADRAVEGRFVGFDAGGRLRLETGHGEVVVHAGDIQESR